MTPRMRLREAKAGDIPRLLAIERQAPNAAHWGEQSYRSIFSNLVQRRICLVVELGPEEAGDSALAPHAGSGTEHSPTAEFVLAGFLVVLCRGAEWEIENVAVDAAWQRRGIASRLVQEILRMACDQSAERIVLEVRPSNRAARSLYSKWAFEEAGRRRRYYRDPEEDALLLVLPCRNASLENG